MWDLKREERKDYIIFYLQEVSNLYPISIFSILYIKYSYLRTYYHSLLFYYAKINFVSKCQKNRCIWKVLFTSKIQIKHVIICYKNLDIAYLLNWFVFVRNLNKVWKSICFGIQIYFKCVLIFETSQSDYVLGPTNGDIRWYWN